MKGIGFIGGGNMAEAMIRGILGAKLLPPGEIFVTDVRRERMEEMRERFGVSASPAVADLLRSCGTVVVAVKPQNIPELLREIPAEEAKRKFLISIAAGIKVRVFHEALGKGIRLARAMPNTPAQVGMGSTGLFFSEEVGPEEKAWAERIFSSFGSVAVFPREDTLDVVTALSGSGPAFVFLFVEALADGAVRSGMGREDAIRLAASTVEGAAKMVRESGRHPGQLKDMVTSPGGTTAAGIAALERGAFRGTVMDAVFAAWQRCRELSA